MMKRNLFPCLRWLSLALLLVPFLAGATDCNCPRPKVEVSARHPFEPDELTLYVDGEAVANPYKYLEMQRDKNPPYRLSVELAPDAPIDCDVTVDLSFPHCTIEHRPAGSSEWVKGSEASIYILETSEGVYSYTPEYVDIRITAPKSDDTNGSPEPGSETDLHTQPANVDEDAQGVPTEQAPGVGLEIPLGAAPASDGGYRSAGVLTKYGPASTAFAAPSSFDFNALPEVTTGSPAQVREVVVTNGSGQTTEKHYIAPYAVLRLRGWNGSSGVDYHGATQTLVEVYEPSQYNASAKTFSGSPHSYYRVGIATGNGFPDGISLVQSNRGVVREESLQVSTDLLSTRHQRGPVVTETTMIHASQSPDWRVDTIVRRDGVVTSRTSETHMLQTWGAALVRSSVDIDDTENGNELVTEYFYYADGRLKSESRPDGSWEYHVYEGATTTTYTPWLSSTSLTAVGELPNAGQVMARVSTSSENGGTDITYHQNLASSGLGTKIAETKTSIFKTTGRTTTEVSRDASTKLKSYSLVYLESGNPSWLVGRTIMSWDDSGKATLHSYEKGDWSGSAFAPNAAGIYLRETVKTGFIASPAANSVTTDFTDVPSRGSADVTVTGPYGVVQEQTLVCNASGTYEEALTRLHLYESAAPYRHTGATINGCYVAKTEYTSPLVTSTFDENGTETETEVDAYGEVVRVTVSPDALIYSQPVTTTYSETGRTRTTWVNSQVVSTVTVDVAGREVSSTDNIGATTATGYANGGRTVTRTLPGGVTEIETSHFDGRRLSSTGSGVVAAYHDYSIDQATGFIAETTTSGASNGLRKSSVTTRWDGSTAFVSSPDPAGSANPVVLTHTLDPKSSATTRIVSSAANTAAQVRSAASASAADALGMHVIQGMETNTNGPVVSSTDRLTETDVTYVKIGSMWNRQTVTSQYHTDNSTAAYVTTSLEALAPVASVYRTGGLRWTSSTTQGSRTLTTHRESVFSGMTLAILTDDSATAASPDNIKEYVYGREYSNNNGQGYDLLTFDASGRLALKVSASGARTIYGYNGFGQLESVRDHENKVTTYDYYPATDPAAGRLWKETNPKGEVTETVYNTRGQVKETKGSGSYRVTWEYNELGERTGMRTYRSGTTGDLTEWAYDPATGVLTGKKDAANHLVNYTYYSNGLTETRKSLRTSTLLITTTYTYNAFGDLTGTVYSDNEGDATSPGDATPDVTVTPDRLGRAAQIIDGSGTRDLTYEATGGGLDSVSYQSGSAYHPSRLLDYTWDSQLRSTGYLTSGSGPAATYEYDPWYGKLWKVKGSGSVHEYGWIGYPRRLDSVRTAPATSESSTKMTRSHFYDRLDRLRGIETKNGASTWIIRHGYTLDAAGRRTRVVRENGQAWDYGYDSIGQVTSGVKKFPDGTDIPGHSFAYTYDGIGNRLTANHGGSGMDVSYGTVGQPGANALNQYTTVNTGGGRFILAESPSQVTVNGSNASPAGGLGFFWSQISGSNSSAPLWSADSVANGGTPVTGYTWTPKATVNPTYDLDGNLTSDGRWNYFWDAENRLVRMDATTAAATAGAPNQRLEFVYDSQSRRISKKVSTWNGSAYAFTNRTDFLYDEWNLIGEYFTTSSGSAPVLEAVHTWGTDLSGSMQGAGGVGGLLSTEIKSTSTTCFPAYDGNGNISGWVKSDGTLLSRRDYSPFGQLVANYKLAEAATLAKLNFGFSTKYCDAESGLLYYGYRYYDPVTGRWASRDPLEEDGGLNLFAVAANSIINGVDLLGLDAIWFTDGRVAGRYIQTEMDNLDRNVDPSKRGVRPPSAIEIKAWTIALDGKGDYDVVKPTRYENNAPIVAAAKRHEERHIYSVKGDGNSDNRDAVPYKQVYCIMNKDGKIKKYYFTAAPSGTLKKKEFKDEPILWNAGTSIMFTTHPHQRAEEIRELTVEIGELSSPEKKSPHVLERIRALQGEVAMWTAKNEVGDRPEWKAFKEAYDAAKKEAKANGWVFSWEDEKHVYKALKDEKK